MILPRSGQSGVNFLIREDRKIHSKLMKNNNFIKTENKSSVTDRKRTTTEYFIDKKAINKNL
ncbi:hypothetical protein APU20_05680 [Klebsiella variicola]|nr:hypothetical protein APU20_05680 [Klebsiella variicola]